MSCWALSSTCVASESAEEPWPDWWTGGHKQGTDWTGQIVWPNKDPDVFQDFGSDTRYFSTRNMKSNLVFKGPSKKFHPSGGTGPVQWDVGLDMTYLGLALKPDGTFVGYIHAWFYYNCEINGTYTYDEKKLKFKLTLDKQTVNNNFRIFHRDNYYRHWSFCQHRIGYYVKFELHPIQNIYITYDTKNENWQIVQVVKCKRLFRGNNPAKKNMNKPETIKGTSQLYYEPQRPSWFPAPGEKQKEELDEDLY